MSAIRFGLPLAVVVPFFLMLGIVMRHLEATQTFWSREEPVAVQRLSDRLAVGQPLPMKKELRGDDARMRVLVARSERTFWQGVDPLECIDEDCGSAFAVVKRLGGVLDVFTNHRAAAEAWGIPLISDRWGTRPAETVTIVTDSSDVVTAIFRHADLDSLDAALLGEIR